MDKGLEIKQKETIIQFAALALQEADECMESEEYEHSFSLPSAPGRRTRNQFVENQGRTSPKNPSEANVVGCCGEPK